ncbi:MULTISPECIES: hypothetical protein [Burkholderia]|uniref:hypothetical protein n=1 Tax=Burkholderia TaxID=32008 RepID=UPI000B7AEC2C|nr:MULTISPECIES: hypothetical protein [Burkholderia]OXJ06169.1 hypothetical protein CFB41_00820 [Burkholderia sp. AU33803]PRD84594.1 hypothetical protein C6P88_37720 [Burkholderia contaminans]
MIAARDAARLFLVSIDILNPRLGVGFEQVEPGQRRVPPGLIRTRSKTANRPGYYCKWENDEAAKPLNA